MRTTVALNDDVAAEVERLRGERSIGVSAAVNELARVEMARQPAASPSISLSHLSFCG